MNFKVTQSKVASSLKQRNVALWTSLVLGVTNLLVVIKLLNQEEHWVLMPLYQDEHKLEVSKSKYSDQYIIDWSTNILNTILCANPDSIDWKISQILKISLKNYGPLKEELRVEAKKIKEDKINTAFYPNTFKVNQSRCTVEVSGEHSAYFGGDSAPIITKKKFQLAWAIRGHGVILLESLKELKEKEDKQDADKN